MSNNQQKDTIENICDVGFSGQHLLTFNFVHIFPRKTNLEKINRKSEYFFFIGCSPGEEQNGSRTYNIKNKITVKFGTQDLAGLAFVLKNNAETDGSKVSPYTKFTNTPQGGNKTLSVWQNTTQVKSGNNTINKRTIFIQLTGVVNGKKEKYILGLTPEQAYSLGENIHILSEMGMKLDLERQMNSFKITNKNNNSNKEKQIFYAEESSDQNLDTAINDFESLVFNSFDTQPNVF